MFSIAFTYNVQAIYWHNIYRHFIKMLQKVTRKLIKKSSLLHNYPFCYPPILRWVSCLPAGQCRSLCKHSHLLMFILVCVSPEPGTVSHYYKKKHAYISLDVKMSHGHLPQYVLTHICICTSDSAERGINTMAVLYQLTHKTPSHAGVSERKDRAWQSMRFSDYTEGIAGVWEELLYSRPNR